MKRVAWVLALVAAGLVGLAWDPSQPPGSGTEVEKSSTFRIPGSYVMFAEGDLTFTSGLNYDKVDDPDFRGVAETDVLKVYILTNTGVTISGEATPFTGGPTGCLKVLKTRAHILVKKWVEGSGWVVLDDAPPWFDNDAWFDVPAPRAEGSGTIGPCWGGYFLVEIYLRVTREGYSDPAGIYTATLSMTISGM